MSDSLDNAAAIVGVSAILPDAPNAEAFWRNVTTGRYSISDVDPERWDPDLYYDPDPKAPERTYSKIGGWVREWEWDPLGWKLPVPPTVGDAMDDAHKWAVACTRMALMDAGWPDRPLDLDRTAVIIGNALSGEKHYLTALRIMFPDVARELEETASFAALPADVRSAIEGELRAKFDGWLPGITEDTMPGELGNCIAGRIANLFNLHGPNFTTDAACASALAAMDATVDGLLAHEFDVAITGGIDRNMGVHTFVKFCAIGALSPSGTRPYSEGADGFVMGEGGALFVVKRLGDAVRDEDRIYAVVRGVGSSSDGKGKGITAPNPVGQRFAIERAWRNAGLSPAECTLVEGHGTSTSVGDAVELKSLMEGFSGAQLPRGSIALGSVKSNFGHLKGAAGAAGMLKATLALHDKVLPPSINFERPNPNVDWTASPFAVNTELRDWDIAAGRSRVAGVSAFGFGGTNFHIVMEEYAPDRHATNGHGPSVAVPVELPPSAEPAPAASGKPPVRGALVLGAADEAGLANALRTELAEARQGRHLDPTPPSTEALRAPERIAIDYADGPDLVAKAELALRVLQAGNPSAWPALRGRGIHRGSGTPGKVAFLYTGQGSQYANMLAELRRREPVVAELFEEADALLAPLLEGRRLSDLIFADPADPEAMARAEEELRRTEIQQPAVITVDTALTRLLGEYGIAPDMVMGHSVGEYGALVTAGGLTFEDALEAVSARGREMASLRVDDPGAMAAVMAPLEEAEEIVAGIDGYVVLANINSTHQVVLGGATDAVARAVEAVKERGHTAIPLPVSHGFHTEIVAPASTPLRAMLARLGLRPTRLPTVANVTGELYPTGDGAVEQMLDMLSRQVASPVQFVKGLHTLYDEGARIFVEVGPKHALQGFASDVLGDDAIVSLASNHPKQGDVPTFNNALCGLWGAGLGTGRDPVTRESVELKPGATAQPHSRPVREARARLAPEEGRGRAAPEPAPAAVAGEAPGDEPVVITGAALGLPGAERLFDDANIGRLLNGEQGIDVIPGRLRREMLDKHITRLVKGDDGGAKFETIDRLEAVIKLAGRAGAFDPVEEFGVDDERLAALGHDTQLAIAVGIDALRDAGIPLVLRYKTTTKGTKLPDRWSLPDELRDDTGVIYASAFPGLEEMADEVARYTTDHMRRERLAALETLRARMLDHDGTDPVVLDEVERRIHDLEHTLEEEGYTFDRRFIFRVLSMGHSQLAELIGARGPNTQINSACASTTQAVALAEDWIRAGRCRRVLIVAADDATSDTMMGWIGAGFLASGAAATDDVVEEAALPFDERRHGMIIGMGAAGLMVESAAAARERALTPICEVLGSVTANSAFHGTRLDVEHISGVMEQLVEQAEGRGLRREDIAGETVFVSHETYTPARGGSAAAEIHALRDVFGQAADRIVIANVKGFTGHPMGVGLEDVLAVKALETGVVPPVPNFRDPDPELGQLNLSGGGSYPVRYSLRLAAGFGSQISMLLLRWTPVADGRRRNADELGHDYRVADRAAWTAWLRRMSGYEEPQLEVVQHRLRIVDQGPPAGVRLAPASAPDSAPAEIEPAALEMDSPAEAFEPAPSPTASADIEPRVLAIVSEETGYPTDLLDMDLDLEADLGIDTVKQAEVFASIRESYEIPFDDTLKLRDYPTLNHVVAFVRERAGVAPAAEEPAVAPAPAAEPTPTAAAPSAEPARAPEPAAAGPEPSAAPAQDDVTERVLAVVSEETGYPTDLLDMDLDLEADLGIDTVKQAEVFASIRESYDIPFDDTLKLRDYPTLNHVVAFVRERAGVAPAAEEPAVAPAPAAEPTPTAAAPSAEPARAPEPAAAGPEPSAAPAQDDVTERVLAVVSEETGYPTDLLDMDLDLEADLGIDTVKQAEVFASIRESYDIPFDDTLKLRDYPTLNHVVAFVRERAGVAPAAEEPAVAPAPAAEPTPTAAAPSAEPARAPEPAAAGPEPSAAPAQDDVTERVLAVVSEETGYPTDLLDMDLDLEADLGIDTVKQAEVFASIRESYDIPFDDTLKLRDYPTLNHVVAFVRERAGIREEGPAPVAPDEGAPAAAAQEVGEPKRFPRRVPVPIVRPGLEHCVPTGVSLDSGQRVIVMPDTGGVATALGKKLRKLGVEVLALDPRAKDIDGQVKSWTAEGPVHGIYWLPALDAEPPLAELDPEGWTDGLRLRVKLLAVVMRELAEQIEGEGTFLIAGTRLGGRHGYDDAGATSAMGGAVTGFVKSLARERSEALVKAIDFPPSRKTAALADILIEETLRDPGVVEVGHADDLRWAVGLVERPAEPDPERALGTETVFCVTGAAGSIVSAITADLAAASGGTFHLLDLVEEPDPGDPDLAKFVSDREGLKRELAGRIKERGERPTPKSVERELSKVERARAALDALEAIRAAGGKSYWHQADLTDPEQVSAAIKDVLRDSGRVDALIHCAGLEVSHFLPDKPQSEFDLVFDVKANGWFNLLNALGDAAFGSAVVFSSIAGRFGNGGQTDYAAASDLLCKSISRLRGEGVRGVAIDWTAWAEIGMASRGSIPKVMEMAGIDMLPPSEGVPVVRRELTAAGPGTEVLIAGALGVMLEERHPTGGLDPRAATEAINAHHGPMTGRLAGFSSSDGFKVLIELDPTHQAFLDHHRIEGTPVLPGVMGIEAFAEAAAGLLPDWQVIALEDIELSAPFKFYRDEPRALELQVLHRKGSDGSLIADCRLVGTRSLPTGEERTVHFSGRAVLAREPAQPPDQEDAPDDGESDGGIGPEAIYEVYFHGPAFRVLDRAWRHNGDVVGRLAADLPADHEPADEPTIAAPRLIELCFQTTGVWELGTTGRMALPTHVDRVIRYAGADAPGKLLAVVHPREDGSAVDARVVDEAGNVRVMLQGYRTIELSGALDAEALEPIRSAMS